MPKKIAQVETFLPKAVAALYEVPEAVMQIFACAEFGEVDLSKIDLQKAEQLADKGYLKKLDQADQSI